GAGHDVLRVSALKGLSAYSAPTADPTGQLLARQHREDAQRAGRRVRYYVAAPDRSVPHADRERGSPLAGETVAVRSGGAAPYPAAEIRYAGPTRLCQQPLLQPLALHRRAPPPRQSEPGAAPDVLGAIAIPPENEQHAACRAERE